MISPPARRRWAEAALRLAALLGLGAAAFVPLLAAQLPRSADGRPHLLRIVALVSALQNGELWPRFSPDLVYGYGYPLFHYYAPFIYYLGAGLHALGLSATAALHLILALALLAGAAGCWALAEAWFGGPAAGLAAAAVYVFAPYTLFNLFGRGAVPEALAVAALPWLLWSLHQARRQATAAALLRLAGLIALVFLTHNLTSLVGLALLLGALGLEAGLDRREAFRASAPVGLAIAAGLALSAFFWLPAFLETGFVQVSELTTPATLDFRNYFLTPAQLLTPSFTFDPRLEPPSIPVALGLPQAGLPILALLLWRRYPEAPTRARVLALAAVWAACLCLTLRLSQPVWEWASPLRLLQFPWRLLGPVTVFSALLAGAGVASVRAEGRRLLLTGILVAVAGGLALPWTFVTRYPAAELPPEPTLATLRDYEIESGGFGLTSTGEFLPVGVEALPSPADLAWPPAAGLSVERLALAALPTSVAVLDSTSERLEAGAHFESAQNFEASWRWFYFPGWRAEVDGRAVAAYASGPHGFVTVPVPAGEHAVRVFFDGAGTPLRQWSWALTAVGALGLIGLVIWARRGTKPAVAPAASDARFAVLSVGLALGLLLGLARWWADGCANVWCRSRFDGQAVAGAGVALDVNFGDRLRLIGFDPPAATSADAPLRFTLYWRLPAPVAEAYSIAVQLWDADGHLVGQQDAWHPGGQPTQRWLAGGYAADAHALTPYPGTPAGEYRLMLGVYPADGQNVEVLDVNGLPLGRVYEVARVNVLAPRQVPSETELAPASRLEVALGSVTLVGVDGLGGETTSGAALPLVLYWRARAVAPDAGQQLQLALAGVVVDTFSLPAGAVVRFPRTVLVPPEVAAGPSSLTATVLDSAGAPLAGPAALGAVNVAVPARVFAVPELPMTLGWRFGDAIELLGLTPPPATARPGEALAFTLYWRALQRLDTRYTVFVHLLDEAGRIAAQLDAAPGQGARPTTGWLPPEVIADAYTLSLPAELAPGRYQLQAGFYDPVSGARLPVAAADGAALGDAAGLLTVTLAP